MKTVMINAVLNGWIVQVGCQQIVYTTSDSLVADLMTYLDDPIYFERLFCKKAVNNYLLNTARISDECLIEGGGV